MQFVGITRFNLVTSRTLKHFNSTANLTLEQAKERVLTTERLETKLSTFERFCLPTYRVLAEQDERSHALVLISHDLPEPYRGRLAELCRSVPRLQLVEFSDEDGIGDRVDPLLTELARGERLFSYRFDDDDMLALDFLTNVETVCEGVPDGTVVSMNRGYVMARLDDDTFGVYERKEPLNAYGLGIVMDGAHPRNPFGLGRHDRLTEPVAHEMDSPSWIAFRHGLNDSQLNGTELDRLKKLTENRSDGAETLELLTEHFPHLGRTALRTLPVLDVPARLEAIARFALRRNRSFDARLTRTRTELHRTRDALATTREELRRIKGSRAFRVGRAVGDTRGVGGWMSLPRRLRHALRGPSSPRA